MIDSSSEFAKKESKQPLLPTLQHESKRDRYWRHQGVRVRMSVSSFDPATNVQGSLVEQVVGYFQRHLTQVRQGADQRLKETLSPGAFRLTRSLTLGLRDQLDQSERANFQHSGLSHILAISGLHIGIGFFLIHAPLIRVVRHRAAARWIAITVVVSYAMLVGLRPSVFRAAIFVVVWGGALTMSRPIGSLAKISVTALIVLILEPQACFDFGAQLSFLGVWLITALSGMPPSDITSWATSKCAGSSSAVVTAMSRLTRGFAQGFQSTVNVLLGVLPLIAFQTGTAAWAVLVLNPLAVLLATILLASGSINFIPGLNQVALTYVSLMLESSAAALQWLAALGQEWFQPIEVGKRSLWALIGFYTILVISMRYIDSRQGRRRVLLVLLIANVLFLFVPLDSSPSSSASKQQCVRLVLVDVGHGSALILQWPDRSIWLVDAGSNLGGRYAARKIGAALERMDAKTVDRLFLSHPDRDHFNAVIPLTSKYNISEVVAPACFADHPDVQWNRTLRVLRNKGAVLCWVLAGVLTDGHQGRLEMSVSAGNDQTSSRAIEFRDSNVEILHPSGDIAGASDNQQSLVLRIRFGARTLVVPGDVESEAGLDVAKRAGFCDLLVAPHHGSKSSDPLAWIESCDPEFVLVSAGHRWPWLDHVAERGNNATHLVSTHRHGTVVLEFDAVDGTLLEQFQIPP